MKKRIWISAAGLILLAVVFVIGFGAGSRWTFGWTRDFAISEVQGNLGYLVVGLSQIRVGDVEGAIELMETRVDIATSTLPQGRDWTEMSEVLQKTLVQAKVYRTAFPPANRRMR